MWMSVWRMLSCVLVRVCAKTHLGATSVSVNQVTGETAHTVKVRSQRLHPSIENSHQQVNVSASTRAHVLMPAAMPSIKMIPVGRTEMN